MRSFDNSDRHQSVLGRDIESGSKRGTHTVNHPKIVNFELRLKPILARLRSVFGDQR